jgi:uncharacterized protein (DUF58 family)
MKDQITILRLLAEGVRLGSARRLLLPRDSMRGAAGGRLGVSAGSSLDFHDYREYHPGDDLRHLDWGVYARSDKEIVKLYREEVEPKLDIVLDTSASMDLDGTRKGEAALLLAAALGAAAQGASCTPSLWLTGNRLEPSPSARGCSPEEWRIGGFGEASSPYDALVGAAPPFRRNGIRIFISDLLWPGEPAKALARLADGASALFVIQLLAASEEEPPEYGRYRLDDVETGETLDVFLDGPALATYRDTLAAHRERWSRACVAAGAVFTRLTDADVAPGARLEPLERIGLLEACG